MDKKILSNISSEKEVFELLKNSTDVLLEKANDDNHIDGVSMFIADGVELYFHMCFVLLRDKHGTTHEIQIKMSDSFNSDKFFDAVLKYYGITDARDAILHQVMQK